MLGTNLRFKKPLSIGEKVDIFRMILKAGSEEKAPKKLSRGHPSKIKPLFIVKNG